MCISLTQVLLESFEGVTSHLETHDVIAAAVCQLYTQYVLKRAQFQSLYKLQTSKDKCTLQSYNVPLVMEIFTEKCIHLIQSEILLEGVTSHLAAHDTIHSHA